MLHCYDSCTTLNLIHYNRMANMNFNVDFQVNPWAYVFANEGVSIKLEGTYQSGPEDGVSIVRGEWVHTVRPHKTMFHQKQVEEAVLVDGDPFSPVPLNAIIFHQHLKKIRLVTGSGP